MSSFGAELGMCVHFTNPPRRRVCSHQSSPAAWACYGPDDVVICESIVHYVLYTLLELYVLPVL